MHRDYQRCYSHRLNCDIGVAVNGHYGVPILAFPTSGGDDWEQEGQGMIRTISQYHDEGRVRIFSINGVPDHYLRRIARRLSRGQHPLQASRPREALLRPLGRLRHARLDGRDVRRQLLR